MKNRSLIGWLMAAALCLGAILIRVRDLLPPESWIHQGAYFACRPALDLLDRVANHSQQVSFVLFFPVFMGYWAVIGALIGFGAGLLRRRRGAAHREPAV